LSADEPELRPAWSRESSVLRLDAAASLDDLSPEWAWGGATGKGLTVAVLDSGVEADHPALEGCVEVDRGVAVALDEHGEWTANPGPHDDSFGHGTACAGIIHALAPEARIVSVKVLGAGLSGKAAAFLRGLAWAIDEGFPVINLSLGTTRRDWALPFYELCDHAYFSNCFLVTAANNINRVSFPSLYASVNSVASNMSTDPFRFHYNPTPPTEFLAPGIDVDVAWVKGSRIRSTGNSYAAPHIAGIAALIRSKHPELRPFQVKTVLWATAANVREAPRAAGRLSQGGRTTTAARATSALRLTTAGRAPGRQTSRYSLGRPTALPQVVVRVENTEQRLFIDGHLVVGRECAGIDDSHRLVLDDPLISRVHLEIRHEGPRVLVVDNSTNGTTLNGVALERNVPTTLTNGDSLAIGSVELRYEVA
jgi:subtilisin family serine protease